MLILTVYFRVKHGTGTEDKDILQSFCARLVQVARTACFTATTAELHNDTVILRRVIRTRVFFPCPLATNSMLSARTGFRRIRFFATVINGRLRCRRHGFRTV